MRYLIYLYLLLSVPFKAWTQHTAFPWKPIRIHYNAANNGIPNIFYDMYKDRKGYIWMGTDRGLLRYNGNKFKLYTTNDGLPDNEIFNIIEDNRGRIWLSTYNPNIVFIKNNIIYNNENSAFIRKTNIKNEHNLYMHPTMLNPDSSILFFHNVPTHLIEVKDDTAYIIPSPPYTIHFPERLFGFLKYADGTYGMITSKGVLHFDRHGTILKHNRISIDQYGMADGPDQSVYFIKGKLLSSNFDTIHSFSNIKRLSGSKYFIPSYIKGMLNIATPAGLHASNGTSSYTSTKPTVALEGAVNDTWVGSLGSGLYNQMEDIFSCARPFVPNTAIYMYTDHLLTTPRTLKMGPYSYLLAKYKISSLVKGKSEIIFNNDTTNKIISVTCDQKRQKLLVCGFKYAYQIHNNKSSKIETSYDFKRVIATDDGYVAITPKALFYLDNNFIPKTSWPRPNVLNVLNVNDSLSLVVNRNFLELVRLKEGKIVQKGIFKSNFITEPVLSATLDGNELLLQTEHIAYKFLWNGFSAYPVRLEVDQLKINKNIFTAQNIQLPQGRHYLVDISLSHIDHIYGDCQYEYILYTGEERSPDWITSSKEQITLLLNNPGKYTLMIRARSSNNTHSNTLTYHFTIPRPLWLHPFFLVIISIIVSGIVFYLIYRVQKRKKERLLNEKERELRFFQSELRSLNALMNPHFTFNALNSIQFLINDQQNETAQKYLGTFAGLLRRNLHNLENEFISLEEEVELIQSYLKLEQMRMKDNFSYSIQYDQEIDLSAILIPPLLIQPLVENAVLHGVAKYTHQEGSIKITITSEGNSYRISVMDNGAATPELNLHKSFGLKNITERIQQINSRYHKKYMLILTERDLIDHVPWTRLDIILET